MQQRRVLLRDLPVVHIDNGPDEALEVARDIEVRVTSVDRPAVLAVEAPDAMVEREGFPSCIGLVEGITRPLAVVRMDRVEPAEAASLILRLPGELIPPARKE